jgi:Ca2+-binding RTX toxin-like protein
VATKNVNFWNDILEDNDDGNTLIGDWRDNVIFGRGGGDLLLGDGGNDTMSGDGGEDELFGQSGNDRLFGGIGDDILNGGADNDELFGGNDNDELRGGQGNDELFGEDGNDTIIDTQGVDRIEGGSGSDTIVVWGGDGFRFDTVSGGSGSDTISAARSKVLVSAGSGDDVINTDLHGDKVLSGGAGSDRFVIQSLETSAGRVIDILGGDGAVERTSNIFGYEGIASVTPGTDTSVDTLDLSQLSGLDASAFFIPDVGYVDKLVVDLGEGLITHVHGEVGFGGDAYGLWIADFASSATTVPIEGQVAKLTGIENVIGSNGGDAILGNAAANDLNGRSGDDFLVGGGGRDTVNGGSGKDVIVGDFNGTGVNADTLTGGADADRFVFADVAKATTTTTTKGGSFGISVPLHDTITDFDTSGTDHDVIDLVRVLDARSDFEGNGAADAIAEGYIYFLQKADGSGTRVMIDLNGSPDGTHNDTANNFAVADLQGVLVADVQNRPDLFLA